MYEPNYMADMHTTSLSSILHTVRYLISIQDQDKKISSTSSLFTIYIRDSSHLSD